MTADAEKINARVRQVMEEIRACTPGARLADVPTLFAFGPIERALTEVRDQIVELRTSLEERTRQLEVLRAKFAGTERARAHWNRLAEEWRTATVEETAKRRAAEATLKQRDAYIAELRAPEELDALMERHGEEMAFLQGQLAMSRGLAQQAEATLKAAQALIPKWRIEAKRYKATVADTGLWGGIGQGRDSCADELEAALTASPAAKKEQK